MGRQSLYTLGLVIALTNSSMTAEPKPISINTKIDDFEFKDTNGNRHHLSDQLKNNDAIVFAFLGTECPLVQQYMPVLTKLEKQFSDKGVQFVAVYPNCQDSLDEVIEHARSNQLNFPVVKDFESQIADIFGARRTPEVFLVDAKGIVRYRGRFDDQYGYLPNGQTFIRNVATRLDLRVAIEEQLAGKSITQPDTANLGCLIGRPKQEVTDNSVTYIKDVLPIIRAHCLECHRKDQIGPFSLTDIDDIQGWGAMIKEVVQERRMPPWHADKRFGRFSNDRALSDEEISLVSRWVDNGMPRGTGPMPAPKPFFEGWNIGKPDLILEMPEEVSIPATGVVDYQWVKIDPKLKEDVWVKAAEMVPGNRAVVHHILMYVLEPGQEFLDEIQMAGYFAAYAPGSNSRVWPKDTAKHIPAGSQILMQMHYTTMGTATTDRSKIGLKFSKEPNNKLIHTLGIAPPLRPFTKIGKTLPNVHLPAGKAAIVARSRHILTQDIELFGLLPHTHVRGKAFRYEAHYPNGHRQVLLNVPRYDFNWQSSYDFAESIHLPKGTAIYCQALFDNSAQNPNNPDPGVDVYWGKQTFDEMMIGYFDYIPSTGKYEPVGGMEEVQKARAILIRCFQVYDRNRDGKLSRNEFPNEEMKRVFDTLIKRYDTNGDGMLGHDEVPGE